MPTKTTEIADPHINGLKITVWDEKTRKENPITEDLIGASVLYASSPASQSITLVAIKNAGEPGFPKGGYLIRMGGSYRCTPVELEEVCAKPPKKKRKVKTNSQLSRKKRRKKKKKEV